MLKKLNKGNIPPMFEKVKRGIYLLFVLKLLGSQVFFCVYAESLYIMNNISTVATTTVPFFFFGYEHTLIMSLLLRYNIKNINFVLEVPPCEYSQFFSHLCMGFTNIWWSTFYAKIGMQPDCSNLALLWLIYAYVNYLYKISKL